MGGLIQLTKIWLMVEPTHLNNMLVKLDPFPQVGSFPQVGLTIQDYFKPPPSNIYMYPPPPPPKTNEWQLEENPPFREIFLSQLQSINFQQNHVTPPKFNIAPEKILVGRWVSSWDCLFLGAMLNFRGVLFRGVIPLKLHVSAMFVAGDFLDPIKTTMYWIEDDLFETPK